MIKIIIKLIGFLVGAAIGIVATSILLEYNHIPRNLFPSMGGIILGSLGWIIAGRALRK